MCLQDLDPHSEYVSRSGFKRPEMEVKNIKLKDPILSL
jgi:hypothetical protein